MKKAIRLLTMETLIVTIVFGLVCISLFFTAGVYILGRHAHINMQENSFCADTEADALNYNQQYLDW